MSETTRTSPFPGETRALGWQLLRECWLPVLVTMLLILLPSLAGIALLHYGPAQEPSTLENLAVMGMDAEGVVSMKRLTGAIVIELAGALLLSPILMLGLHKGLLGRLRGTACSLRCIFGGWKRWKTAIALELLTILRILGYLILGSIGQMLVSFIPLIGGIAGAIGYVVLTWWATLRYMLAGVHLADDADGLCSASDCLDFSIADVQLYSFSGVLQTIWPALIPALLSNILTQFFADNADILVVSSVLDIAAAVLQAVFCVCIFYTCLHRMNQSAEEDEVIPDGLARARALAAGQDYTEE